MFVKLKAYVRLFRIKHYLKNGLIFLPLFFSRQIWVSQKLLSAFWGMCAFCFVSSIVYIFNDLKDVEKDKQHPTKKFRPIASGEVKPKSAILCMIALLLFSFVFNMLAEGFLTSFLLLMGYLLLNIFYSLGLKNKPLVDIVILASGFTIRVVYGAVITDVVVSNWMYLTVFSGSFYMGFGKRRNELRLTGKNGDTRTVLKYYTYSFLDKNMYVCLALVDVFYALWAMQISENNTPHFILTVPIIMILLMKYSLDIESDSDGDPIEVIFHDKILMILAILYAVCLVSMFYIL